MRKQQRTTFILAAVAAALLAFVWFYERHTLTSTELHERRGKVLDHFVRAHLTKLEIQRHGRLFELDRLRADDDEDGSGPYWELREPVRADADDEAVNTLLGELEYLEPRRTLEGVSGDDRHRMGLDRPRLRLFYTVAGERLQLVVGSEDPRDEGVFVATGDASRAYVVGKDLFEALDKEANDFRDKRLFGGAQSVRVADDLVLRGGADGELHVHRDATRWSFQDGQAGWASREELDALLGALDDLRAARFVEDAPRDMAHFGLAHPHLDVVAQAPASMLEDGGTHAAPRHAFRFRVGTTCAGHDGERYAIATRDGHDGPVVCADVTDIEAKLTQPAAAWRDARIVTMDDETVDHVSVATSHHRLDVHREGDGFRYALDGSHDQQGASQEGIAHWLDALRALRATDYAPVDTAAHGTDHPRATLVVAGEEGTDEERVVLGESDLTGAWVRRGDEPVALHVGLEAEELLAPDAVVIRAPSVVHDDEAAVSEITVTREAGTVTLARNGDDWEVTSPHGAHANVDAVRSLLRLATTLEAVRWSAPRAAPRMGLATPRVTITLRGVVNGASTARVVRIGAATQGGSYADVDADPAVFVVADSLSAEVERLLEEPDAGSPEPEAPATP